MDEIKTPEVTKELEIKELQSKVTKYLEMEKLTDLLAKNVIEFEYNKVQYRVSKPTFKQKAEVNEQRVMKYVELLKNPNYLLEKDLIKIYKDRGVDIYELDSQMKVLADKKNDLLYKLGESIKKESPDDELKILKTEIEKINIAHQDLAIRKITYLDSSIESQLGVFIYTYFAFLLAEKREGENWIKAWTNYDTFMNEPEALINTLTFYISFVIKTDLPNV